MSNQPTAGSICHAIVPSPGERDSADAAAHEALVRACAEHGLRPTDEHLVWSGPVADAPPEYGNAFADLTLPQDMSIAVYEATAA